MPTFTEQAGANRNLRVLPAYAPPLPHGRATVGGTASGSSNGNTAESNPDGCYDVVIVGAGPAGLFLKLLLARYGLDDRSVLCVDQKPGTLQTGQADGLQPRTLEVLSTLGLAHEVLTEGCAMWEVGFWNEGAGGIERTSYAPDVVARARYPHEITIHQGRIERVLAEDLARYSPAGVRHSTRFVGLREEPDHIFPLAIDLEVRDEATGAITRDSVRARHLVAADGAHSAARRAAGLRLEGESRDHIWGVVDFVADSDFPDIRRRCAIHSAAGSAMVIPRERIASGEYLTRLYVQMDDVEAPDGGKEGAGEEQRDGVDAQAEEVARQHAKKKRGLVTLDTLFDQAAAVFRPYHLRMKAGSEPDWWAAYQIGQRMANAFTKDDEHGIPRVFVVGDAAHTHSPKAGQGMNVSLMDSYNLAWKLAYYLRGLVPVTSASQLLHTYSSERAANARNLIDFDTRFSTMFSGKVGSTSHDDSGEPLTHEKFLEVFSAGSGFSSGCGIEYTESLGIATDDEKASHAVSPWVRTNWPADKQKMLLAGALWPGRRLVSLRVVRHADGVPVQLHDALPSTGRLRVVMLLSKATGTSDFRQSPAWAATEQVGALLDHPLVGDLLEMVVLHPTTHIRGKEWADFPPAIKKHSEMRFFCAAPGEAPSGKKDGDMGLMGVSAEDGYAVLGVNPEIGAWATIRPDGVIGATGGLDEMEKMEEYLRRLIKLSPS